MCLAALTLVCWRRCVRRGVALGADPAARECDRANPLPGITRALVDIPGAIRQLTLVANADAAYRFVCARPFWQCRRIQRVAAIVGGVASRNALAKLRILDAGIARRANSRARRQDAQDEHAQGPHRGSPFDGRHTRRILLRRVCRAQAFGTASPGRRTLRA
jgi:hypothetical protein